MLFKIENVLFFIQIFSESTYFIDIHEKTLRTVGIRDYPVGIRGEPIFLSLEPVATPDPDRRPHVEPAPQGMGAPKALPSKPTRVTSFC